MATAPLPPTNVPFLGDDNQPTLPWRRWLQQTVGNANLTPAQIAALQAAIAAAQATANTALADAQLALSEIPTVGPTIGDLLGVPGLDLTFKAGANITLNAQAGVTLAGHGPITIAATAGTATGSLGAPPGWDGLDGEDGWPMPGQVGATGPQGPAGSAGSSLIIPGIDGLDGESWAGPPNLFSSFVAGTGISIANSSGVVTITNVGAGSVGAMVLISEVVTSSSQSVVTFSSIATTWRDLVIRIRGRGTTSATNVLIAVTLNNDTGTNYDQAFTGSSNSVTANPSVSGASNFVTAIPAATATASESGYGEIIVYDYKGTTFFKSMKSNSGLELSVSTANIFTRDGYGIWRSTAAVNRVDVTCNAGGFVDNSVVSLYGSF